MICPSKKRSWSWPSTLHLVSRAIWRSYSRLIHRWPSARPFSARQVEIFFQPKIYFCEVFILRTFWNIFCSALSAHCIATGYVRMTSIDHLHEEAKIFPVQDHLFLISSQYLARAIQPNNPFHNVVAYPSGIRNMKQTLQSRFLHCVAPYLSSGIRPPTDYWVHNQVLSH